MNRLSILFAIFLAWSVVVVARLSQLMLFPREAVRKATTEAWVPVTIPAMRGCILDRNGRYLAWTERYFAMYWRVPSAAARASEELELIRQAIPASVLPAADKLDPLRGKELLVNRNMGARDLDVFAVVEAGVGGVRLQSYFRRCTYPDRNIRRALGEVQIENGEEVGVSGEEKKHDELLRGRPGRFRVIAGRDGQWVKNTWTREMDICPGYDVYLPISVGAEPARQPQP